MAKMLAARLHEPGQPFHIDEIERPQPRAGDLLVKVKTCGIIPNMNAIVSGKYWHHLPPMPAIIGLDAAGVVVKAPTGAIQYWRRRQGLHQPVPQLRSVLLLPQRRAHALR